MPQTAPVFVQRFDSLEEASDKLAINRVCEENGIHRYSVYELDETNRPEFEPGHYVVKKKWVNKHGLKKAIELTSYELWFHIWN